MLSILIPTYNYNVVPLVKELHEQCLECDIVFEILVYDDGSKSHVNSTNNYINSLQNCTFKELPNNIGRSAIRNLLGTNAAYEKLIFLDADVIPLNKTFIKDYLSIIHKPISVGGLLPTKKTPNKPKKLRWIYTKKREYKTLSSSNFLIQKEVFKNYPFDENIKKYGYEDVLFFSNLKRNNIRICFLKNPVVHHLDDDTQTFLNKTEDAMENLSNLAEQNKLTKEDSNVIKYYQYFEKLNLVKGASIIFNALKKPIVSNLNSDNPSLLLYDLYRIGYFCQLKTKK